MEALKGLITKNNNLLVNIDGVYFFVDPDLKFLSFSDYNEWERIEEKKPEIFSLEEEEDLKKVYDIFYKRSKYILSLSEKSSILQQAKLTGVFYTSVEVGQRINIQESSFKFFFGPKYVFSKKMWWMVVGVNYREDGDTKGRKIYIHPSFGKGTDVIYFKIKQQIKGLDDILKETEKEGNFSIAPIKNNFFSIFKEISF